MKVTVIPFLSNSFVEYNVIITDINDGQNYENTTLIVINQKYTVVVVT